jgi:hypothetical protein
MHRHASRHASEIGEILEVDRWARQEALSFMN